MEPDYKGGRRKNKGPTAYNSAVCGESHIGCVENGSGRCAKYPVSS